MNALTELFNKLINLLNETFGRHHTHFCEIKESIERLRRTVVHAQSSIEGDIVYTRRLLEQMLLENRHLLLELLRKCGHGAQLFVFFGRSTCHENREGFSMITQILVTDTTIGAFLILAETKDGQPFASSGPFDIAVDDPGNAATVTKGSADNTTPTRITANGSNNAGDVTVTVTDQSTGAVGKGVLSIVATPPPPVFELNVGFDTATPPAPPAPAPSGD